MKNIISSLFAAVEPLVITGSRKNFAVTNGYFWDVAESHGYYYARGNKQGHSRTYKKNRSKRVVAKESLAWSLNMEKIILREKAKAECFNLLCGCEVTQLPDYSETYVYRCNRYDCCNPLLAVEHPNFFIENVSDQYNK